MATYLHKPICTILFVGALLCTLQVKAQPRLGVVYPYQGGNKMLVKWNAVAGAQEYEYRRKVNNGAFGAWTSKGTNTSFEDTGLTPANSYTYQVRVKVADVWSTGSNEKANSFQQVWPVKTPASCASEIVECLHGFGQALEAGGSKYFHEGLDINGDKTKENECVKAPMGGIVLYHGGTGANIAVNLEVYVNGATNYIQFNHLGNLNANLVDGETVAPGDSLGVIANGTWSTLTAHTHCHFWSTYADLFGTSKHPLNIWSANAYKDPQGKDPELMDTNGDGEFIRFRKTPASGDYFPDTKLHNGVDIVAEVIDKLTTSAPYQTPARLVGYYIQKEQNGAWVDAVKSSAAPYILVDHNIYYQSNSSTPNTAVVNTIIDYRNTLKATKPAGYDFEQWFTYQVTNTKGTTGAIADLDSNQYWATDARATVAEDNGYKAAYDKARVIDEAKFPDGKYKVLIRHTDFLHQPADREKEITVDNFRPYIKKVEIKSGKLNYSATWNWNSGDSGKLKLADNTDTNKACGSVKIIITASEPMKEVSLNIPSLTFTMVNNTPKAGTQDKVFEFEIPADKTKDAPAGPHKLEIGGKDKADNEVQGFTTKTDKDGAEMQKKQLDGTFTPNTPPVKDTIHRFKLVSLNITVSTTDAPGCDTPKGKADIAVTPGGNYEYSVDGGAYQASGHFENLAKGNHTANVRDKNADCVQKKDFTINSGVQQTSTFYRDFDNDGYGSRTITKIACTQPSGYVTDSTDCNDNNAAIHPNAPEVCDGKDNNCNGMIDEALGTASWYRDFDGDGFGNPSIMIQSCYQPGGYVANNTDCDDRFASIYPGAPELCNGRDDNCNRVIDEGLPSVIYYKDNDHDGFGNRSLRKRACTPPQYYVTDSTDCDDSNPAIGGGCTSFARNGDAELEDDVAVNQSLLMVYPNPSRGSLIIKFRSSCMCDVRLKIYDLIGRPLLLRNEKCTRGDNYYRVSLQDVASGNYFVEIATKNEKVRSRITVER